MSDDPRDVLQVLCYELNFIEQGGYDRLPETASPFLSTSTCLNFDEQLRPHACRQCLLSDFAPPESLLEDHPCHYIRLNDQGETVATLLAAGNHARLRSVLCEWLRGTIARLEVEAKQRRKAPAVV